MSPAEELLKRRDDAYREELRRIGEAIGYGNAQSILGELWDEMLKANYGTAGRGRMGVTVDDGPNAQDLADEIKRLADDLQARSRDSSKRTTVDKLHAAIDSLRAMVPPQPTEPLTGTESPDYQAGWKAGYKHGAWCGKLEPQPAEPVAVDARYDLDEECLYVDGDRTFCAVDARNNDHWRKLTALGAELARLLRAPQAAERKPFTSAQVRRLWDNSPQVHADASSFAAFSRIVDLVQAAHGIPSADAKEGGNA